MDSTATVEAKEAFEHLVFSHNVAIKHYHYNNGLFDTLLFKKTVQIAH